MGLLVDDVLVETIRAWLIIRTWWMEGLVSDGVEVLKQGMLRMGRVCSCVVGSKDVGGCGRR